MNEYPVKNMNDVQHVVGLIQYSSSAFRWPGGKASSEYVEMIDKLNKVATQKPRDLPGVWMQVYPPIRDKLLTLMKQK